MPDENQEVINEVVDESQDTDSHESSNSNVDSHESEIEEKARKMGHVPKDQFKGDPDKWVDAQTFVERGENHVPILRKQIARQQEKLDALNKTIKEFSEYHTKTEQRAYERAYKELKAAQIQAVANADQTAFVELDQQISELQAEAATKVIPQVKDEAKEPEQHPDFVPWQASNSWYGKDKEMSEYADAIGAYIARTKPGYSYSEALKETTEKVKKEFPDKFTNPKRNSAASVESSQPSTKKGGKTFADLSKEQRTIWERWNRDGIKITKEEYVKSQFEDE